MTDRSTGAVTREGTRAGEAAAGSIEAFPAPPVVGSADGGADRADHRQPSPRTVGGAGPTLVVRDRAKSGELQECIEKALVSASGVGGQDAGREGEQRGPGDHRQHQHQNHEQQQHDHQEPHQLLQISNLRPDDIHVLVVDDEMMSRTVVSTLLKKFKYTVTTAEDGAEAMELLKSSPPGTYHLVLTDVRMPKLNGIELLQYIRSEETLRSVPVVMMSGYDGEDVVGACEQGGAEEYLVKPVGAQEVANIWHHVLKKRGEATTVPQSAAGCEVAASAAVDAGRTDGDGSPSVPARPVAAKAPGLRSVYNRKLIESLREQSTITGEFLKMMREKRLRECELLKEQVMLLQEDCDAVSHLSNDDGMAVDYDGDGTTAGRKRKDHDHHHDHHHDHDLSWLDSRGLDASYFAKIHRSTPQGGSRPGDLREFASSLNAVSRRSALTVESTIRSGNMANPQEMVCYADFDADDTHFATVSVSRSVKVFDYTSIVEQGPGEQRLEFPIWQATTRSKLSSVSWNSYLRSHLITSDYDGAIQLWDVSSGMKRELTQFEGHNKRVWSIDWSRADPMQFASASDDATVKVWDSRVGPENDGFNSNNHTAPSTIKLPANACSVHFNARRATTLAVGCANHACYVFDTRRCDAPLAVLTGPTRAVSYTKWHGDTVFAASTDSAIRSWELGAALGGDVQRASPHPTEVFSGTHVNERNFVGLSVSSDGYVATGSEDNSVVVYYHKFPFAVCRHDLGGGGGGGSGRAFASSVCWARGGGGLLVGNSEGCLVLLRLR